MQRDNKHMRDTIMKLEQENEYLTRELVGSKASLREEMDRVCVETKWSGESVYNFHFVFAAGREDRHSEQGGQSA